MKTKKFDCVEMKRLGAQAVQKEIAGLTRDQELKYWKRCTEKLKKQAAAAKARRVGEGTSSP